MRRRPAGWEQLPKRREQRQVGQEGDAPGSSQPKYVRMEVEHQLDFAPWRRMGSLA